MCLFHIPFFIYSLINRRGVIIPEPPASDKYGAVRPVDTAPMVSSVDDERDIFLLRFQLLPCLLPKLTYSLERFSNDCRKTKVIIPTNQNVRKQRDEPISNLRSVTCSNRGKNRAYKVRLILVLLLIG